MESKKLLVAGPFYGEFGYELMTWQPQVRKLSEKYNETVVVAPGMEFPTLPLYSDFARPYPLGEPNCSGLRGWKLDYLAPTAVCDNPKLPRKFIKFGVPSIQNMRVVIHARNLTRNNTGYRNWASLKWRQLCQNIKAAFPPGRLIITAMGSSEGALCPVGCDEDCRGWQLRVVMNIVRNALVCVGPSSGFMHLASLCGCPHVVWTETGRKWNVGGVVASNRERYETLWNPFKTPVQIIDSFGWDPPVGAVTEVVLHMLKGRL